VRGFAAKTTLLAPQRGQRPKTHRLSISITRHGPPTTGYTRTKRTARFPVNTRESASFRDDRWRPEIDRILQGVAGSNPVIPTEKSRESKGSRDFLVVGVRPASSPPVSAVFLATREHDRLMGDPFYGSRSACSRSTTVSGWSESTTSLAIAYEGCPGLLAPGRTVAPTD